MSKKEIGVGLISVGWMGKVHSRAFQALPIVYPELGVKPRLVIAADTVQERIDYAQNVLGYESGTLDYHEVLNHPDVAAISFTGSVTTGRKVAAAAVAAVGAAELDELLAPEADAAGTAAAGVDRVDPGEVASPMALSRRTFVFSAAALGGGKRLRPLLCRVGHHGGRRTHQRPKSRFMIPGQDGSHFKLFEMRHAVQVVV